MQCHEEELRQRDHGEDLLEHPMRQLQSGNKNISAFEASTVAKNSSAFFSNMNEKSITNKGNIVSGGLIIRVLTFSRPENMDET